jgi:ribosome-associated protein
MTKIGSFENRLYHQPTATDLIDVIGEALLEKKAENIRLFDVRKITTLTDYFVICHGSSDTQVKALGDNVLEHVKKNCGEYVWKKEGQNSSRWIVLDYVNVVVHIFQKDMREYYGIEKMWNDAEISAIADT